MYGFSVEKAGIRAENKPLMEISAQRVRSTAAASLFAWYLSGFTCFKTLQYHWIENLRQAMRFFLLLSESKTLRSPADCGFAELLS